MEIACSTDQRDPAVIQYPEQSVIDMKELAYWNFSFVTFEHIIFKYHIHNSIWEIIFSLTGAIVCIIQCQKLGLSSLAKGGSFISESDSCQYINTTSKNKVFKLQN